MNLRGTAVPDREVSRNFHSRFNMVHSSRRLRLSGKLIIWLSSLILQNASLHLSGERDFRVSILRLNLSPRRHATKNSS